MTEFQRQARHDYEDPLSRVWLACAESVGFQIVRTEDDYASSDGKGTIRLAVGAMFDPDDCLAQMILHELCHALVEGEEGEGKADWGLGQAIGHNPWREHAALRLQAYLAAAWGLRDFFAPTTDFRLSFWDTLPADPFAAPRESGGRRERSCVAARLAAWRATLPRWANPLRQALAASAAIAAATPRLARQSHQAAENAAGLPSLWETVQPPPPPHPSGHSAVAPHFDGLHCSDCAWGFHQRGGIRCRHEPTAKLPHNAPACWRFEPMAELDCQTCGACCREAYHAVELSRREPLNALRPDLVVVDGARRKLLRDGDRCAALQGGRKANERFYCSVYADRPRTCQEFVRGGANCLDARRRVGLSL